MCLIEDYKLSLTIPFASYQLYTSEQCEALIPRLSPFGKVEIFFSVVKRTIPEISSALISYVMTVLKKRSSYWACDVNIKFLILPCYNPTFKVGCDVPISPVVSCLKRPASLLLPHELQNCHVPFQMPEEFIT